MYMLSTCHVIIFVFQYHTLAYTDTPKGHNSLQNPQLSLALTPGKLIIRLIKSKQ